MVDQSKKHHFVPRSVLKKFSIDAKEKQIYVYDKKMGCAYVSSIMDAGSENKFNSVQLDDQEFNLEGIFDQWDGKLAGILTHLMSKRSLAGLTTEDLSLIKELLIVQYLRTKIQRDTLIYIQNRRNEILEGLKLTNVEPFPVPSGELSKAMALKSLSEVESYKKHLDDKALLLFEPTSGMSFYTSDNPVVFTNTFSYGGIGLTDKGVEIYYPVAKDLAIGFWCDTIFNNYNREKPENIARTERLRHSLNPIKFNSDDTEHLNKLQITYSSRFVYTATNESKYVSSFLLQYPMYKEVNSNIVVGEIGEGRPARKHMPPGDHLVVWTASGHYMLAIRLEPEPLVISFYTDEYEKLKQIREDFPIQNAEVYRDGNQIRALPKGVIYNLDYTGVKPNLIGFEDRSLEELLKTVLKGKL